MHIFKASLPTSQTQATLHSGHASMHSQAQLSQSNRIFLVPYKLLATYSLRSDGNVITNAIM